MPLFKQALCLLWTGVCNALKCQCCSRVYGLSSNPCDAFRQWYEELGGEVVLLGKPAAVLYEEALRMLGLRKDEVLAIGDSLQHDIAGAALPMAVDCWS